MTDENNIVYLVDKSGVKMRRRIRDDGMVENPFKDGQKLNIPKIQVRDDDIFLAAYQSCGTHWVWEIISMLTERNAEFNDREKEDVFLEMFSLEGLENWPSPRIINSHLLPQDVGQAQGLIDGRCKVVYVTRNPKDAVVSMYKHMKMYRHERDIYDGRFEDFFELMMGENQEYTMLSWFHHTMQWEKYLDDNPQVSVLYLYYEDMKEDLEREVFKIVEFLSLDVDGDMIRDITEKCTFDKMKAAKIGEQEFNKSFYRKGQVGTWKEYFTVEINERFDKIYLDNMKDSKIAQKIRFTL